jgi:hypothetical protein
MGSGKTTVLGEASDLLAAHGIVHATLDLDAFAAVGVADALALELTHRNLAASYEQLVGAGLRRLLLAEAVETRAERLALSEAMPNADLVVCRLTASFETKDRRLRVREPGINQKRFVIRARELDRTLDAAGVEDFTLVNDARHVTDVARELLTRAGWLT